MGFLKSGADIFRKVEDLDKQQRDYERMMAKMRLNTQNNDFEAPKVIA